MGQNAYLFIWNHEKWEIEKLIPIIDDVQTLGSATDQWSIAGHKKVHIGDRAFLTRSNATEKGIFASGKIIAKDFTFLNHSQKSVHGVVIEFDTFINPTINKILPIDLVKNNVPVKQKWPPQSSGTQIKSENVSVLEMLWAKFCVENNVYAKTSVPNLIVSEGTSYEVTQTIYERNRYARILCLQHHGYSCIVCGFNFEKIYGDIGKGFIHVHHLNPLSNIGNKHETNPIIDLRPVCPNCHAMLHKTNPPYTVDELKCSITFTNMEAVALKYIIIKNKIQYDEYCDQLEALLTLENADALQDEIDLLTLLIEKYDEEHSTLTETDPITLLRSFMGDHHLKPQDLSELLGISKGYVSDILNYKKGLSKGLIRKLAEYFKVRQEAFNRPYQLFTPLPRV